jgi:DNA-binding NarL/FixJ family response regulator
MTFLKKLREYEWGKNIQVLVLTNLTDSDKINNSMNLRVDGYLVKSDWKLQDLVDRVKTMLSQNHA